ncbi:SecY-interacting protein Syd [Marinobacterium halophilum]|nr:SecY-interacting protein Syd [Marinobacterium halophilum]
MSDRMMMDTDTAQALDSFMQQVDALHSASGWPRLPYDPDWPSQCYQHTANAGVEVSWHPVHNHDGTDMFDRLSTALGITIHPALATYFSRYWSDPLPARLPDGREICLLQAWNPEDLERLRANLVGHALSKHKQKRPLTLFFATLEPDTDYFLSIDNQSGHIWLERPGKPPQEQLASSLGELLRNLTPLPLTDQS